MAAAAEATKRKKHQDAVDKLRDTYEEQLSHARVAVEHNATEGWQLLYSDYVKSQRDRRKEIAKNLRNIAELIEKYGPDEDTDKSLGDVKKRCAELQDELAIFRERTVNPVRQPVEDCQKVLDEAKYQARSAQSASPLHNAGIEEAVEAEIARLSKVVWVEESGRVLIKQADE